jgi:CBS domain containing-hemolysin-like protein
MDIWPFVAIIILLLLSAFFSGSEIAFTSVSKSKLRSASEKGSSRAGVALYIYDHYEDALSTILIGNNLVNIAASAVSAIILIDIFGKAGAGISTLVMTVLILIFGEITPKIVAKQNNYKMALFASYPIRILMFILKPIIVAVVWVVEKISGLWAKNEEKQPSVTEDELVAIIENVTENGIIDEESSELLQSAIEFSDITVEEILTPRIDMVSVDINDSIDEIIQTVMDSNFSRIPVYDDSIDNIIGILLTEHFLKRLTDTEDVDIRSILIDVCYFHQTMTLPDAFTELQKGNHQIAIVTDEYGGTMGLITMEDILEELVGDIWDEADEVVSDLTPICENTYEVSGDMSVNDFLDFLDLDDRDFESEYTTVGGWAIEMLDGFPDINDSFEYENLDVTVTELDGRRVEKLVVKLDPDYQPEEE